MRHLNKIISSKPKNRIFSHAKAQVIFLNTDKSLSQGVMIMKVSGKKLGILTALLAGCTICILAFQNMRFMDERCDRPIKRKAPREVGVTAKIVGVGAYKSIAVTDPDELNELNSAQNYQETPYVVSMVNKFSSGDYSYANADVSIDGKTYKVMNHSSHSSFNFFRDLTFKYSVNQNPKEVIWIPNAHYLTIQNSIDGIDEDVLLKIESINEDSQIITLQEAPKLASEIETDPQEDESECSVDQSKGYRP
jgi:hypothetical protein